jgi:hypothetical protein
MDIAANELRKAVKETSVFYLSTPVSIFSLVCVSKCHSVCRVPLMIISSLAFQKLGAVGQN